jgi:hypothetical protein
MKRILKAIEGDTVGLMLQVKDWAHWWALLHMVMNIRFSELEINFLIEQENVSALSSYLH